MTNQRQMPATTSTEAVEDLPGALAPELEDERDRIRVRSTTGLLAIVPHLLGFKPSRSLVIIGTGPPNGGVIVTLRYDLPDPADPEADAAIAAHAMMILTDQAAETAFGIGYGPGHLVTPLADTLRDAASSSGVEIGDFLRVQGQRYWSYVCNKPDCCPPEGKPFADSEDGYPSLAPGSGPVLSSRDELAASVAAVNGDQGEAMRQATHRAEQRAARLLTQAPRPGRENPSRSQLAVAGIRAVTKAIGRYREGGRAVANTEAAWLALVLQDIRVRDDAWARMDPEHREEHLRLWTDVTRRARHGYVAAPASLLAFVAWQSGNGGLANVALDRALADDPDYSMARLLRQVIGSGAPPSMARLPMTPEEVAAAYA
jgi:hypothetical protein